MKPFSCGYCYLSFVIPEQLENHVINDHWKQKTEKINEIFDEIQKKDDKLDSDTHLNIKEDPQNIQGENASRREVSKISSKECYICNKVFWSHSNLEIHMKRLHSKIKEFPCSFCNKKFSARMFVKAHEKSHFTKKETPFKCELCYKFFISDRNLKLHEIEQHSNKHKFDCKLCDKKFLTKSRLRTHEIFHTKRGIHKCHFCEEKFCHVGERFSHLLKDHSEIVDNEVKSKMRNNDGKSICLMCNLQGQRRTIQYHLFYKVCDKNAQEHKKQVKRMNKKKCEFCIKEYMHEQSLLSHVEEKHKEKKIEKGA